MRLVPLPILLIAGVVGVSILLSMLVAALSVAVVVGAIGVPILIATRVARSVRRGRYHSPLTSSAAPGPALTAPHRPAGQPGEVWRQAKDRFAALRSEYAAYECDAIAVLRLPALADVAVPSTARFVEAFAEAQALDVDGTPPPATHCEQYAAAVERAWAAWRAAREAAERIRLSHLPPEERTTVERVVRLLTTARDTDNEAERLVAYGKARSELAKLERAGHIHIPRPAQAMLDDAYRGQLPA